jgi:hypothetical protein
MTDEKKLPPDVAERYRRRLAEIRLTMPHWGGGSHRATPEAEAKLESNIGESITRIMARLPLTANGWRSGWAARSAARSRS